MSHDRNGGRKALLRAVSVLGISLGISAVALADESPKQIGSATSGAGAGKASNQYKADYLKHSSSQLKYESGQIKGESHQWKLDSNQIKGESHQLKLDSHQYKQGVSHELNPQPLPPG